MSQDRARAFRRTMRRSTLEPSFFQPFFATPEFQLARRNSGVPFFTIFERFSFQANRFFDLMLYFNLIIVLAVLFFGINHLTSKPLALYEKIGLVLSIGIVLGTNGINVAHELGHRKTKWERFLA